MSTILNFLEYWHNEATVIDREPYYDDARRLYDTHVAAVAALNGSRAKTLRFLQPVKNSKGAWVPGFSSDKVDEVSTLATEIAEKEQNLKSLCHDIETFLVLTDGQPVLKHIAEQRARARGIIAQASRSAEARRTSAAMCNRGASLEELLEDPDVQTAEKNLQDAKTEFEPVIAEMTDRLTKIHEIIDRYENH